MDTHITITMGDFRCMGTAIGMAITRIMVRIHIMVITDIMEGGAGLPDGGIGHLGCGRGPLAGRIGLPEHGRGHLEGRIGPLVDRAGVVDESHGNGKGTHAGCVESYLNI